MPFLNRAAVARILRTELAGVIGATGRVTLHPEFKYKIVVRLGSNRSEAIVPIKTIWHAEDSRAFVRMLVRKMIERVTTTQQTPVWN